MPSQHDNHQLFLIDLKNFIIKLQEEHKEKTIVSIVTWQIILKIIKEQDPKYILLEKRIKGE